MQFDSQRAFPYPVLRPDVNDYVDGEFQAIVELDFPEGAQKFLLTAQFALSVDEIAERIASGDARYVLVVACRDTYSRWVIETTETKVTREFDVGSLRGEVEINPYIVAEKEISNFSCALINKEFGDAPFHFEKGAILAVDTPTMVYVDRDAFKPITSIFELVVKESVGATEWNLDCSGDYVRIGLSPKMKERIDIARNSRQNRAILINSLYFAAVMQCVRYLKEGEHENQRWVEIFKQQCHNHNLSLESPEYIVAQTLLKGPLALLDAYVFQESVA